MPHVSFSAIKNWDFCPFYHKLTYVDDIRLFKGNVHTAFGKAVHLGCEKLILKEIDDPEETFQNSFAEELRALPDDQEIDQSLVEQMGSIGGDLCRMAIHELNLKFPGFHVVSVEEEIVEPILDAPGEFDFKGYIDLVIKTPDDKYHIVDWKTCSWGWSPEKKNDKITNYQLAYYKKFFCDKHDVDPKDVEVFFGLLKRTAKKDNAEIFRVSSGERKINNSLKVLNQAVYNIHKKRHPKNKLNCRRCEFHRTEWCP